MTPTEFLAAGRHDLIPGKKFAWFRTTMLAEVSEYLKNSERESLLLQASRLMRKAEEIGKDKRIDPFATDEGRSVDACNSAVDGMIRAGTHNVGSLAFKNAVCNLANLPMLAWVSLRVAHPEITLDEVKALITPENENKIHNALLELLGYFEKKLYAEDGKTVVASSLVLDRTKIQSSLEKYSTSSQTDTDSVPKASAA